MRYCGIYVRLAKAPANRSWTSWSTTLEQAEKLSLWAEGIKSAFDKPNPTACCQQFALTADGPLCQKNMRTFTIFAPDALRFEKRLRGKYFLASGDVTRHPALSLSKCRKKARKIAFSGKNIAL